MQNRVIRAIFLFIILTDFARCADLVHEWHAQVRPPECRAVLDSVTGRKVIFLSTARSNERNFDFTHNSFLADGSMVVFLSDRSGTQAYYGFILATGEWVQFLPDVVNNARSAVVSRLNNILYVVRKRSIFSWKILINRAEGKSDVRIREHKLGEIPEGYTLQEAVTENADGSYLSMLLEDQIGASSIAVFSVNRGELRILAQGLVQVFNLQFSHTDPERLMYRSGEDNFLWLMDFSGVARKIFLQAPDAWVSQASWWNGDWIAFCGGDKKEDAHVTLFNVIKQESRRINSDPNRPENSDRSNWIQVCGSPDGRRLAVENRNGDIALLDAETVRFDLLVRDQRTIYSNVSWDTKGKWLVFTSDYFDNSDVCIIEIGSTEK